MLGGEVEHAIHVLIVLHFRSLRNSETDTGEYILYLLAHQRQRMTRSQRDRIRCAGEVQLAFRHLLLAAGYRLAKLVDTALCLLTKLVKELTHLPFLVRRHIAKLIEERSDFALLTKVFDT